MKRLVSFGGVGSAAVLLCLFIVISLFSLALDARSGSNTASVKSKNSVAAGAEEDLDTCNCGRTTTPKMWADVSNDVAINPADVIRMVNYNYCRGVNCGGPKIVAPPGVVYPNAPNDPPVLPLTCQYKLGDVNRDGAVNPADCVRYVNYVYKNRIDAIFDNPCLVP